jgi:hypothetical protein
MQLRVFWLHERLSISAGGQAFDPEHALSDAGSVDRADSEKLQNQEPRQERRAPDRVQQGPAAMVPTAVAVGRGHLAGQAAAVQPDRHALHPLRPAQAWRSAARMPLEGFLASQLVV